MTVRISKQTACTPCINSHLDGLKWVDLTALEK